MPKFRGNSAVSSYISLSKLSPYPNPQSTASIKIVVFKQAQPGAPHHNECLSKLDEMDFGEDDYSQSQEAAKIIELSKKNRALNLALEKEKQKVAALQAEKAKGPSTPSGVASPHASPALDSSTIEGLARSMVSQAAEAAEAASKEAQAWKEKAQAQTNRVSQAEQRAFSLEIEIKKLQRALTREVGEEIPLSKVLEEGSDWKGRRETIIALRDQVKQLRESQGLTTKNKQEVASEKAISSISSKKAQEMEKLTQELSSTRTELELTKAKLDGAVSRRKVLENDLTALKEKVGIVLEKTTTDDKLIAALKAEVATLRRSGGTSGSGSGSGGLDDELFWREMSALKSKCQEQEGQLSRQEAIIKSLTAQAAKSAAD